MKELHSMDFAYVVKSKEMKDTDLTRGEIVMVMGDRMVPASSNDPYLLRKLVVLAKVVNGVPQIPNDNNEFRAYLADPRNLEKVEDDLQKELADNLANR